MAAADIPTSTVVSCRCAVTLAEQAQVWASVELEALRSAVPWRTFRWYKGQKHCSGTFWSATERDLVIYESRLELARLLFADFDTSVGHIVAHPFLLRAPARVAPEPLSGSELRRLGADALADYNKQRRVWHANLGPIKTPQLAELHEDLWDIVDSNTQDGDKAKSAVAIDAFPGLGKTTSVLAFAKQFHLREIAEEGAFTRDGHERWPVCRVGLTGNTGMKDFNRAMLEYFAHPGRTTGTTAQFAHRALDCVLSCAVRIRHRPGRRRGRRASPARRATGERVRVGCARFSADTTAPPREATDTAGAASSGAKLDGQDVRGVEAAAIMGRSLGNEKYLWGMDPCDSCKAVVAHYGIRFRTYDRRNP
ncbi:hypothetical protein [Amycolatopsis sp. WAC 01375]|uniref:hypothetical protein n=1 Tax=Amycolatopsis sp. WAC 01375 TaxID=2203194 RepID=UPI0018F2FBC1|nr:hypothetical protein [Amycolatopsis sp. WAC 01375]